MTSRLILLIPVLKFSRTFIKFSARKKIKFIDRNLPDLLMQFLFFR